LIQDRLITRSISSRASVAGLVSEDQGGVDTSGRRRDRALRDPTPRGVELLRDLRGGVLTWVADVRTLRARCMMVEAGPGATFHDDHLCVEQLNIVITGN
jgi:hypothetical protein